MRTSLSFFLSLTFFFISLQGEVFFKDDFDHLKFWNHDYLPNVERPSKFRIVKTDGGNALSATSQNSGSYIHFKESFNPYHYADLTWRWRVNQIIENGNAETKSGDDFSLRIAIVFKYDPQKAGFFKRAKYAAYKSLHGEYPPDSALHYVWANKKHKEKFIDNPYADEVKMIFIQSGSEKVGTWMEESVNVLKDYRDCFGEEPPEIAELCVMADSDNTGESSSANLDWIKLQRP